MPADVRGRAGYAALAVATIALGLVVFGGVVPLEGAVRDVAGDAIWAAMIVWWVSALAPRQRLLPRGACALAVCWAVEISQLAHGAAIDAIRRTTFGHLVFGSGFDPRDFLAYSLGVTAAVGVERIFRSADG